MPTDQFTSIAQRGQEAATTAVRTWTETLQRYATTFTPEAALPSAADAHSMVNTYFDLATQVLADQRALASELIDNAAQATDTIVDRVRTLAAK